MAAGVQPPSVPFPHLLAVLAAELAGRPATGPVRILDAGCGDGGLLAYLQQRLPARLAGPVELHGFDVQDGVIQLPHHLDRAIETLAVQCPGIDWKDRVHLIDTRAPWPFDDASFEAVVSNQVVEHVHDLARFFGETSRVLRDGGVAIHVFPTRSCLWEVHLDLPLAHRIGDHDLLRAYIRLMSRLGLGKFKRFAPMPLDRYVELHADYVTFLTRYRNKRELFALARAAGLRPSYRYTGQLVEQKLRQLLRREPLTRYRDRSAALAAISAALVARVSSVTLLLRKRNTYRH